MAKKTRKKRQLFWMKEDEPTTTTKKEKPARKKKAPSKPKKTVTAPKDKVAKKKPVQRKIAHQKRVVTVEDKGAKPKSVAEVKPEATTTEKRTISPAGIERLVAVIEDRVRGYVDQLVKTTVVPGSVEIPIYQRSQPSLELKRDSKGAFSYTIKCYADSLDESLKEVTWINNELVEALDEE